MLKKKKDVIPDQKIIDNIKALGVDMIFHANSGHPGIVLGAAPIIYTLYTRHLNVNPNDDKWLNRDRFILSAGHGSALLYATLYLAGFNLTLDDLKEFRRINSKTPGHPEYKITSGVDASTGPLGQGIGMAVGMAMAERFLVSKYNIKKKGLLEPDHGLFDYYTYVLCSDGDLMEGISYEALSLAGTLKLNKLILLYDSNNISLDGKIDITFNEDVRKRFQALGWDTFFVKDGENVEAIDKALLKAKRSGKPSLIEIKTILGKDSFNANTSKAHGSPLTKDDITNLKNKWGIRDIPFAVSKEAVERFRELLLSRSNKKYDKWVENYKYMMDNSSAEIKQELDWLIKGQTAFNINLPKLMWQFNEDLKESMRDINGKIMNVVGDKIFNFIGGNADLASSTKAFLKNETYFNVNSYHGRNIAFGVREHAMGAILNGLSLSGFRTFGGTFLTFADYLKPSIRLAALMNLPVTYVFTHDSIMVGPDGPTHQPIEQLAMLRSIPNLDVYRPADIKEIVGAWDTILKRNNPSALIIARDPVPFLKGTNMEAVEKGAYIVRKETSRLAGLIIATGTEVETALVIAYRLKEKGIDLRVVSMPSVERFLEEPIEYQEEILPTGYKVVVLEASSSLGWFQFVYNKRYLMTIDQFGKSGTRAEVLKEYQYDVDSLTEKIENLFK